jgi:hypothetical protein
MGAGDHDGAVRRDESAGDGAARLQEFACHHHVDVARSRGQRQHRPLAAEFAPRLGKDFDVVRGGAGTLGDARDGGALHRQIAQHRRGDDPVGEHAPAFAAERADQQRDGTLAHAAPLRALLGA